MAKRTVSVDNLFQINRDIIEDEWWPWMDQIVWSGTWNGNASGLGMGTASVNVGNGRAIYVTSAHISATPPCRVSLQLLQTNEIAASVPPLNSRAIVGINGATFTPNVLNRFGGFTRAIGASISGVFDPATGVAHANATTVTINQAAFYSGYQGTDDTDFGAPYVLEVRGDSIAAGTGPTRTEFMWAFMLRNLLRDTYNYRARLRNLSLGGTTTAQWEDYRKRGYLHYKKRASLIIVQLGTNDSSGSAVTKEAYWANILLQIQEKQRNDPAALMLILAPPPKSTTGDEATLAQYRSYLATQVPALNDPLVKYVAGTGSTFNPATQSGTYTTDGTHLNNAGNALNYQAVADFLAANGGQVAALLPR